MAAPRIALVVEAGPLAGATLTTVQACRDRGIEATIALTAEQARAGGPFVALAKTLDVGVRWPAWPEVAAATAAYEAVLFAAGRVPSCVVAEKPLPHESCCSTNAVEQ